MPPDSTSDHARGRGPERSHLLEDIKAAAARDPERMYQRAGYTRQLKAIGPHLVGLCPFHEEKTPSFKITVGGDPEHVGTWYCHGACKEGGSIVDFLLRLRGASRLTQPLVLELGELLGLEVGERSASLGEPEATYDYQNAEGELVFQVVRFAGKDFRQRRPDGEGGWIWNLKGVKRVPYGLPLLIANPDALVLGCEGEKDADAINKLVASDPWEWEGIVATTNSGGAGKWMPEHTAALAGRGRVALLEDNDQAGRDHVQKVAQALVGTVRVVKVVALPDLPRAGDVRDWLAAGHTLAELLGIVAETPAWEPGGEIEAAPEEERPGRSQADRLVELVLASGIELFHDQVREPYARGEIGDHGEVWRLGSKQKRCQRWLGNALWEAEHKVPGPQAIAAALNVLEAKAGAGPMVRLHNRIAAREGALYYDLSDAKWRAVRVTAEGWSVVDDPPPLFRRYSHQQAQVEPDPSGDLTGVLDFLNLGDAADQLLMLVYIVSCFVPDYPHVIPVLYGPQGSAKSTLLRAVRRLVDPSAIEIMSFPDEKVELAQMLAHHWTAFFDNIRSLPQWLSDMLCRASTGEGFSKRQLYTDEDDVILTIQHCIGLTGVNAAPRQADLLDRCLFFKLPPIADGERRTEKEFWAQFEEQRPALVGGAFNVLARAMAVLPSIAPPHVPRMADFAHWGCAITEALGSSQREFLTAYSADIEKRHEEAVQASPVAELVVTLLEDRTVWQGTASELHERLSGLAESRHVSTRGKGWPQGAHILSRRLNEATPSLGAIGIRVTSWREKGRRVVRLETAGGIPARERESR